MKDRLWTTFITAAVMIAIFFEAMVMWSAGHRAGQVEALGGQVHYELSNGYYIKVMPPINIICYEREE